MSDVVAEHQFDDERALADALACDVAGRLRQALALRGRALLAVSGGRSPVAFFQALSQQPLDWARVTAVLVDERCVAHHHSDSNTGLVRLHLLRHAAAALRLVPFFEQVGPSPDAAQLLALSQQAEIALSGLPWPLDVAVLGMGTDGHTASWFPNAAGTAHALSTTQRCAWVRPEAATPPRLTLTLSTLLQARHLVLQFSGADKRAVYTRACAGADASLPVSLLLCQRQTPIAAWIGA